MSADNLKFLTMKKTFSTLALILIIFTGISAYCQDSKTGDAIKNIIETGKQSGKITVDGTALFNQTSLPVFYSNHNYAPAWSDHANTQDILEILKNSYDEGLNPQDYYLSQIEKYITMINNGQGVPEVRAKLDLLLTDATSLYADHLLYGKVMQSDIRKNWNVPKAPTPSNPDSLFTLALSTHQLPVLFDTLKPANFMYTGLREGLNRYRTIAANGGWDSIPAGETLKKGMTDERVALLRKRLNVTGDLSSDVQTENENYFDEVLETAVKKFQFRHNLNQDGAVGKNTLARMNIPVEDKINALRVNMERGRWVMHYLDPDFLVVNIAGFNLRRVTNGEVVFYSPVIVGRKYHETPIFKSRMIYFEINPTWTVPYSIATKEMLPKLKKNPGYLKEKNMVIMNQDGTILDPSSIDFSKYSRGNFPFTIRQEPGPRNALGRVKFIFPNPYSVYVHDTPGQSLFSREERDFSHGCIRTKDKWGLLMNLMDEPDVWNMEKINEILATKKTTRVNLKKPINIFILYWTAGADKEDRIFFDKDVYDRDGAVLEALDKPVDYHKAQ